MSLCNTEKMEHDVLLSCFKQMYITGANEKLTLTRDRLNLMKMPVYVHASVGPVMVDFLSKAISLLALNVSYEGITLVITGALRKNKAMMATGMAYILLDTGRDAIQVIWEELEKTHTSWDRIGTFLFLNGFVNKSTDRQHYEYFDRYDRGRFFLLLCQFIYHDWVLSLWPRSEPILLRLSKDWSMQRTASKEFINLMKQINVKVEKC